MTRFILHKLSEKYNYKVTFDPKPEAGDWNGCGGHINFYTKKKEVLMVLIILMKLWKN